MKSVFSTADVAVAVSTSQQPVQNAKSVPTVSEKTKESATSAPVTAYTSGHVGFSIKGNIAEASHQVDKQEKTLYDNADNNSAGKIIQPEDLIIAWRMFAKQLPKEEIAIANRFDKMIPELTADNIFEIVAENPSIEDILHAKAIQFLPFMRKQLSCPGLNVSIRLRELVEKTKILTKREQLNKMKEENFALIKLINEFSLDF
ncbi:MAG: hypothetical protein MJZ20_05930 [Bacteroidaceae bacterium]|nr:hypothetical protein [Bacteroidaceae bacterium]